MSNDEVQSAERKSPRQQLKDLLKGREMVTIPAVPDAFAARAAQEIGFDAVYLGGGVTVSIGAHAVPDMTMVSIADIIGVARPMVEAIDIPLIVDFDDAGGNPLQVRRSVQLADAAGIAGLQIEDTDFSYPKHLPPKQLGKIMDFSGNHLLSRDAAVARVRAAVEARKDPDLVIIARTDGALLSFDEAITRMKLFEEAGADVIYPSHIPFEKTREVVEAVNLPVLNCPVRVGSSTAEERRQARDGGLRLLLESTPVPYAAYRAVLSALTELRDTGGLDADFSSTLKTVQEIIDYPRWGELAARYAT